MIRDALTEYSYVGEMAGLFYSLKPNKMGVELSVRGYSENQNVYLAQILSVVYGEKTFSNEDRFESVYEMHRKGVESSEADPLKSQVKFLLCSILCPRTFSRTARMKVRSSLIANSSLSLLHFPFLELNIHFPGLVWNHPRRHCRLRRGIPDPPQHRGRRAYLIRPRPLQTRPFENPKTFFYGNLTLKQADAMSTSVIEARKEYLERVAFARGVVTERNTLLEEWFVDNPAERIVALEKALSGGGGDGGDGGLDKEETEGEMENNLSVILEEGEDADSVSKTTPDSQTYR